MKGPEYKIFNWYPQGDFRHEEEEKLLSLLEEGWTIEASNTVNEGIYYILYRFIN